MYYSYFLNKILYILILYEIVRQDEFIRTHGHDLQGHIWSEMRETFRIIRIFAVINIFYFYDLSR